MTDEQEEYNNQEDNLEIDGTLDDVLGISVPETKEKNK